MEPVQTVRFSPDPQQRTPFPDVKPTEADCHCDYSGDFGLDVEAEPKKRIKKKKPLAVSLPLSHHVRQALTNFFPGGHSSHVHETIREKSMAGATSSVKDGGFRSDRAYGGGIEFCYRRHNADFKAESLTAVQQRVPVSPPIIAEARKCSATSSVVVASEDDTIEQRRQQYHLTPSEIAASPNVVLNAGYDTTALQVPVTKGFTGVTGDTVLGTGNSAGGSDAVTGGRKLLSPHDAGDDDFRARNRQPVSILSSEQYFTKDFVEFFLKADEAEEFMKQVDLGGVCISFTMEVQSNLFNCYFSLGKDVQLCLQGMERLISRCLNVRSSVYTK